MNENIVEILLIEDNPADVRMTQEAFKDCRIKNKISVIDNGVDALLYLRKQGSYKDQIRPDLILLDLNIPQKNGKEVLLEIKNDPDLKKIPVIIVTSSLLQEDVLLTYNRYANCYIIKPVGLDEFTAMIKKIETFWFETVKLPPR